MGESWGQLKKEWRDASGFSVLYWMPLMFVGFRYVPQEMRILYITGFSLVHKAVLSWFSNRHRVICADSKNNISNNTTINTHSNTNATNINININSGLIREKSYQT